MNVAVDLRTIRQAERQEANRRAVTPGVPSTVHDMTLARLPHSDPQSPLVVEALRQLHAALGAGMTAEDAQARVLQIIYLADSGKGMKILHAVARKHRIHPETIRSADRFKPTVAARRELCQRLRDELNWSFPRIGDFIGRDHSSVLNLLKRSGGDDE